MDNIAISDKSDVVAALSAYESLSTEAKAKLTAEKTLLDSLMTKIGDLEAAAAVDGLISALPEVGALKLSDRAQVEAVRSAYEALTADQKVLVTKLDELAAAEAKIVDL